MTENEINEMKMMMDEDKEHWALIEGTVGYEISTKGRVRSYWKKGRKTELVSSVQNFMKIRANIKQHYFQFMTRQKKMWKVHTLLAKTFIPNPENKPCVDHIDRNRQNDLLQNLRWCSRQENSLNSKLKSTNTSGKKGVTAVEYGYIAYWMENRVRKKKFFKTFEEASAYRDEMVQKYYDNKYYTET